MAKKSTIVFIGKEDSKGDNKSNFSIYKDFSPRNKVYMSSYFDLRDREYEINEEIVDFTRTKVKLETLLNPRYKPTLKYSLSPEGRKLGMELLKAIEKDIRIREENEKSFIN